MRRTFLTTLFLLTLALVVPVGAASIVFDFGAPLTLSPTARHVAAFQAMVDRVNADRAAQTPPLPEITIEQFLRDIFVGHFKGMQEQIGREHALTACATYQTLSAAKQAAIKTELGGLSPCS